MESLGQIFHHRKLLRFTDAAAAGDNNVGFVELRTDAFFDVALGDVRRTSGARVGNCDRLDHRGRSARCLGGKALRTDQDKEWA